MDMKRSLSPTSAAAVKPRMVKSVSFRAEGEDENGFDDMESDVSFINSQSAIDESDISFAMSPFTDTPEPPSGEESIFSPKPPMEQSTTTNHNHNNIFKMDSLDEFYDWQGLGERYDLKKIVGSGSYGKVAEAYDRGKSYKKNNNSHHNNIQSLSHEYQGERVAIKQCQNIFQVLKESKQMLRELFILRALSGSDQIVSLLDVKAVSRSEGQPFRDL